MTSSGAGDLVALLAGRWSVERVLRDARGAEGAFAGEAVFTPAAGGLRWHERGRLRYAGHDGDAQRELAIVPDGAAWLVRFADGRPFHPLDLRSGACAVEHRCGADEYRGEYRLLDPGALAVRWRVEGPRKRDEIATAYRRLDG